MLAALRPVLPSRRNLTQWRKTCALRARLPRAKVVGSPDFLFVTFCADAENGTAESGSITRINLVIVKCNFN